MGKTQKLTQHSTNIHVWLGSLIQTQEIYVTWLGKTQKLTQHLTKIQVWLGSLIQTQEIYVTWLGKTCQLNILFVDTLQPCLVGPWVKSVASNTQLHTKWPN